MSRGESRWVRLRLAALVVWLVLAAACVAVFGLTVYLMKATLERTFQLVKPWRMAR